MESESQSSLRYLDSASTSFPKPSSVLEYAITFCQTACVSPGRSSFDLAIAAENMQLETRKKLTALFGGTDPNRLVFGYNATDALNLVIFGILKKGGHVVTTRLEHNSVLRPIEHCIEDYGATATYVSFDSDGYIDPADIRKSLRADTRLVVVCHGSNVLGTVQPIGEIGPICREAGVPFCIDAAQSAGLIPIDMKAMSIDIVAFTGHKSLLATPGIGGLCVGAGVEIPHSRAGGTGVKSAQRLHLEEYPYRLEYGTPNMLGIASLSKGVDVIHEHGGVESVHKREMELASVLYDGLSSIKGVKLYCANHLENRTPLFSFNIRDLDPSYVGARLDVDFDIACRTGLHCAPLAHEDMGTAPLGAVRLSIGFLTTIEDVNAAVAAVAAIAAE
ncbi:MAG: aminotransferase class V-fold PLP-dependent enzyme [Polyangiaceae bacterium]|nr:aminotransferase class V-fold PLP-dependent enzyme [Polyangiaceae bacterium]